MFRLFSNSSILGLDIGFEALKLVELKKSGSRFSVVGAINWPLTDRMLEHDHFKNKKQAGEIIKQACAKAKPYPIQAKKIVSALPETFVFSKTIQMPKMKMGEYKDAVPIEAAQYLPIPAAEVYLDFQVLISHPDDSLVDILLVASPRHLIDEIVEVTRLAGLELLALETKPMAGGRALLDNKTKIGLMIIEIGSEVSRISIWEGNNIQLVSTVSVGKNEIEKQLAKDNGKKDVLLPIVEEIFEAIKYHQNRGYKPKPIEKLLLCGSGAGFSGIEKFFTERTKIKSETAKPLITGKTLLGTGFVTAIGLAMRQE